MNRHSALLVSVLASLPWVLQVRGEQLPSAYGQVCVLRAILEDTSTDNTASSAVGHRGQEAINAPMGSHVPR